MEKDYRLRKALKYREFKKQHDDAINEIAYRASQSGNSASYGPARTEFELRYIDERAKWSFQTCCEIWEIQGRWQSRAFFRAVFEKVLSPLFSAYPRSVATDMTMKDGRTGKLGRSTAVLEHFDRDVRGLTREWDKRLEIEARNNEYQERLAGAREAQETHRITVQKPKSSHEDKPQLKKPGPTRKRDSEFETLAGSLWREAQSPTGKVNEGGLARIAKALDASQFNKPSDYLEGKAAQDLKDHNQKFANSNAKKIMSWTALVEKGDKDQVAAMRKLLSRCAGTIR